MIKILFLIGVILISLAILISLKKLDEVKTGYFRRKEFLFDTAHEYNLFKIFVELFGDKYYIFPQISYSHIFEVNKSDFATMTGRRSMIDRKSADFVFCDKEHVKVVLVIELDGYVHNFKKKRERDNLVNRTCEEIGIPIIHFKNGDTDREFIKKIILEKLQ